MLTSSILRLFRLPPNHLLGLPIVFALSATMHTLPEISMNPVPDTLKMSSFFLLCGLAVAIEGSFKKLTGRRVSLIV